MKGKAFNRMHSSSILWAVLAVLLALSGVAIRGQTVVDKTVATVSDGSRTELITYSDLLWQLALQPGVPLDPPREEDIRQALQTQIDQRIFALEAERLPRPALTQDDIAEKIGDLVDRITPVEFQRRLRLVGFTSVSDPRFEEIIRKRVAIEKYLDFRFRSFVVVTAEDEANYYRDTWAPLFLRENPGSSVRPLDEVRSSVNKGVVEERVALSMERFLEEAKRRVQVVMLSEPTLGR